MSNNDEIIELLQQIKPDDMQMRAQDLASCTADGILIFMLGSLELLGATCTLEVGKYKGRRGVVTGVLPDAECGLRLLVSINQTDGDGFLDGDGETRTYWRHTEVKLDPNWIPWTRAEPEIKH